MSFTYPVSMPWLQGRELDYVTEAVGGGWISSQGPYVRQFEEAFAAYNDVPFGVACSSGTTALTLALRALGVGPGDEVIVPEFTMIASAWAVTYTGATPVFVDCGDDLNIDVSRIEEKITPRTKVIMPVHIYGRQCDMDAVLNLAYEYNLRVVEDSAEAHGVRPRGDIACFSLFANKIISAGEGGVCLTHDPHLAEQMAHLRAMAFTKDHSFLHKKLAYNFRMTNMQAAVALAQTEQLDTILARRRDIEKRYDEALRDIPGITLMPPRDVLWMYDLRAERRDELCGYLAGEGVETRVFFKPMSRQPGYFSADWPTLNAARLSADGFYLPTHTGLTAQQQEFITGRIRAFYGAA
ncbi:DegT/DnrJ/EryC1/StrS family aminotransferase [Streptomyces yunnanensis]|uniref:DegT/DnrJ/EryC1/StrS family aminotransferase n=1 Tax=Streptomyces yunnanensis TaxID=156453 RepID=A0ABY8A0E8_9ACTN|nr:DegT/DnrJ/EryC1/StrS family aminotransferase [Streptomyces yunnanensis]WEB38425.1 DegT/DnrJ/EryC1/StrS family aminotransferase [Streptomyces yunnanensis]